MLDQYYKLDQHGQLDKLTHLYQLDWLDNLNQLKSMTSFIWAKWTRMDKLPLFNLEGEAAMK